jgi:hypothetical protein
MKRGEAIGSAIKWGTAFYRAGAAPAPPIAGMLECGMPPALPSLAHLPPAVRLRAAIRTAWFLFGQLHPAPRRMLLLGVLPLSLLPPLMLYYAGSRHGDEFMAGFSARPWDVIALIFWQAELYTIGLMGATIRWIAHLSGVKTTWRQATLLAFIAPAPLWLSALALFVPSFAFCAAVGVIALLVSAFIIYHGVAALLGVREDICAAYIAYGIMAAGLIAWALLLAIIIPIY